MSRECRFYFPMAALGVWLYGVYIWGFLSNLLVGLGLLVSSKKPHLFTLPLVEQGMNVRTLVALLGVLLIASGAGFWVDKIRRDEEPDDQMPTARSQLNQSRSMDMGGMGMGGYPAMGMGGMGGYPPMGGMGGPMDFGMPPNPMSPPPGTFS